MWELHWSSYTLLRRKNEKKKVLICSKNLQMDDRIKQRGNNTVQTSSAHVCNRAESANANTNWQQGAISTRIVAL